MKLDQLRAFAALTGTSATMPSFWPHQAAELVEEIDAEALEVNERGFEAGTPEERGTVAGRANAEEVAVLKAARGIPPRLIQAWLQMEEAEPELFKLGCAESFRAHVHGEAVGLEPQRNCSECIAAAASDMGFDSPSDLVEMLATHGLRLMVAP